MYKLQANSYKLVILLHKGRYKLFWDFCCVICFIYFKLLHRLKVEGKENVLLKGRVIFAANHQSYLDVSAVGVATYPRKISFMAKEELFHKFWLRPILKALYGFPVKKEAVDKKAYKTALAILGQEQALGLFPEGTRHRPIPRPTDCQGLERFGQLYHGVALLALRSGAPIIPIAISGTEKVLPDDKRIPRLAKITIKFGQAIEVSKKENRIERQELEELTGQVMARIGKLLEEVENEGKGS